MSRNIMASRSRESRVNSKGAGRAVRVGEAARGAAATTGGAAAGD